MKISNYLFSAMVLSLALCFTADLAAQTRTASPSPSPILNSERLVPVEPVAVISDKDLGKVRQEADSEEEAAILPYYNNYLREYHLGPEDVISVEVFGQPNYSKTGIVIPPTANISYPLVPGGVFVGGKTVEQVAVDIKRKLEEYIIDPQVSVTIEKVGSAKYSVLGKVESPGVKTMNRRYNLYEAIAEAGGISKEGDKKRVLLIRLNAGNGFTQTVVNLEKVMKGQVDVPYLAPGDQIVIPEKRWSLTKILGIVGQASAFRVLFGSPF